MSTDPRFAAPTPFARLVYAHAASVAGDACIFVSLAGSVFFSSPTSAARGKVLLYLLITIAPFAVIAPVLGPALDRIQGGRRLLVVLTALGRAVLCLAMALYILKPSPEGLLIYPLAFGMLVLQKGYTIARSSLVPAVVKEEGDLVAANSRIALVSVIGGAIGGAPAALIYHFAKADWSLRFGAVVFVGATILAFKIPKSAPVKASPTQDRLEREEMRIPSVLLAGSAMAVLRAGIGFLFFLTVFSLKNDTLVLSVALGAIALGNFVGVIAAPILRRNMREEVILASSLAFASVFALLGAMSGGGFGFVLAMFALGMGAQAGRLGFDSLLQRDGPDAARGRAFARFETRFQLVWVVGSVLGTIPLGSHVGLFLLALVLGLSAGSYFAGIRTARGRTKLLPDSVDRALARSREQAVEEMRSRIRRRLIARRTRQRPSESPPEGDGSVR